VLGQIPTGIIADGFMDVAVKARKEKGIQARDLTEKVMAPPKYLNDASIGDKLHILLSPDDDEGVWFDYSMLAFLAVDVSMVVIESDSDWRVYMGDEIFANLEGVAAMLFSVLYILRKPPRSLCVAARACVVLLLVSDILARHRCGFLPPRLDCQGASLQPPLVLPLATARRVVSHTTHESCHI